MAFDPKKLSVEDISSRMQSLTQYCEGLENDSGADDLQGYQEILEDGTGYHFKPQGWGQEAELEADQGYVEDMLFRLESLQAMIPKAIKILKGSK